LITVDGTRPFNIIEKHCLRSRKLSYFQEYLPYLGLVSVVYSNLRISDTLKIDADENFDKITWSQAGIPKSGNINRRRKSVDCRIRNSKLSRTEVNIIPPDKSTKLTDLKGIEKNIQAR
jgi:hypothetical protein